MHHRGACRDALRAAGLRSPLWGRGWALVPCVAAPLPPALVSPQNEGRTWGAVAPPPTTGETTTLVDDRPERGGALGAVGAPPHPTGRSPTGGGVDRRGLPVVGVRRGVCGPCFAPSLFASCTQPPAFCPRSSAFCPSRFGSCTQASALQTRESQLALTNPGFAGLGAWLAGPSAGLPSGSKESEPATASPAHTYIQTPRPKSRPSSSGSLRSQFPPILTGPSVCGRIGR